MRLKCLLHCSVQLLKDLPAVDNQLALKTPGRLAGSYCTNLGLYIVGILRKFHACLLVSHEQTASAFERYVSLGSCITVFSALMICNMSYLLLFVLYCIMFSCCQCSAVFAN